MVNVLIIVVGGLIILGVVALLVKVLELADKTVDGDEIGRCFEDVNVSIDDLTRMFVALEQKVDYADELRIADNQSLQDNINRKANGITRRVDGVTKTVQGLIRGSNESNNI
jgi:hypothetical protein